MKIRILCCLLVGLTMVACGGSSSSRSAAPDAAAPGTVNLVIGDAPIDYDQAIIVIDEIRLIGGSGQEPIVLDEPQTIDLLELENLSELLVTQEVPAGTYSKIRLLISELYLTRLADNGIDELERVTPRLPANGKIDLNPRGNFTVRSNEQLTIEIDMDLEKSIKITGAGNSGNVQFRPVVFVKILSPTDEGRLQRFLGTATSLGAEAGQFMLCDSERMSDDDSAVDTECFPVTYSDTTSIFGDDATPIEISALNENDSVLVFGYLANDTDERTVSAQIIAKGDRDTFVSIAGDALTPVVAAHFDMTVDSDHPFPDGSTVGVDLVGTAKSFNRDGDAQSFDVVMPAMDVEAIGVVTDEAQQMFRAFLVLTEESDADESDELEGNVTAIDSEARELTVETESNPMQCIRITPDATILIVSDSSEGSEQSDDGTFADIAVGQEVETYNYTIVEDCAETNELIIELEE